MVTGSARLVAISDGSNVPHGFPDGHRRGNTEGAVAEYIFSFSLHRKSVKWVLHINESETQRG